MNEKDVFAFEEDQTQRRLLRIARTHVKLTLEYGKPHTLPERQAWIKQEIERLREESDQLMRCETEEGTDLIPGMT